MKNIIFMSPNFPTNYWMFCRELKNNGLNVFEKGQEKGYFEQGGSTIVLFFEKDKIKVDDDILEMSGNGIETKVRMGERIGVTVNA